MFIFRIGYLGDLITSIDTSQFYNAKLLYTPSYKFFFGLDQKINQNLIYMIKTLSRSYDCEIEIINFKKIIKLKIKEIHFMTQSITIKTHIFRYILNIFGVRVKILNEASQWFYKAIELDKQRLKNYLKKIKKTKEVIITICPDGKEIAKRLSINSVNNIINFISQVFPNNKINLIGIDNHYEKIKNDNLMNLINKTSLEELIDIIKKSNLIITTDTGTLHIAHSFDVPTICFVALRYPIGIWWPFGGKNALISNFLVNCRGECLNCNLKKNICINDKVSFDKFKELF